MPNYQAGTASIDVRPNLSGFVKDLKADLERIDADYSVDVSADLSRFREQIAGLNGGNVSVNVDLDGADSVAARISELARNRNSTIDVDVDDKGGLERTKRGAEGAERSLSGMGAVKFGGLASAITALVPALLGVAGAAGGAVAALGAIGGVGVIGSMGLKSAFEAVKAESDGAGKSADELADKQHNVDKAARDVADAQKDLADAQRDAKKAQQDLADSYEDARRSLRDMNDELVDSSLAQEDAEISLARAQQRRNEVYAKGGSRLDRAEADLGVKKAQQRLKETKSDHADKVTDTGKANRKGIDGSDEVKDAKEKKAEADNRVADSQAKLADAAYNLAKAQKALQEGSGAADKAAQAMAKLAPNAQDFVRQMQSLGPAWKDLRMAVQDKLFDGLGASVKTFANQNLPGLKSGLTDIAGYMNGTLKQTLSDLSGEFATLQANGKFDGLKAAAQSALSGVSPMITGLTDAMVTMASTVGPALGPLFTSLGDVFKQIGPSLGEIGRVLGDTLTTLMPHLGGFIEALARGLAPVLPVLGRLIGALGDALQPLIPPLSQVLQVLGNALAEALPIVAPFFSQMVGLVGDLLAAVAPLLPPLLKLLSAILTPLAGALRGVIQSLAPVIKQMADGLKPVIAALVPVMEKMYKQLGDAWISALKQLMPFLPQLVKSLVDLAMAMIPLLPQFADLAAKFLPMLAQILAAAMPHLIRMIEEFTKFTVAVMPYVIEIVKKVVSILGTLMTKIGDLAGWASTKFGDIVGFVKDMPSKIASAATGMWDGIKNAFKTMINWIIRAWNKLEFKIPAVGVGPLKTPAFTLRVPHIEEFASGGYTGPGGKHTPAGIVHAGEHVIRKESRDRLESTHPGVLDYINRTGALPGYADGGKVDESESADRLTASMNFAKSMAGTPYQMGGFSPQAIDCSGLVAAVVNVHTSQDGDAWAGGRMSTVTEGDWLRGRGFVAGKGGRDDITVGWYDQGGGENGHTAGVFPGGVQFESHGPTGAPAEYGTGSGVDQPIFTDFAHLAVSGKASSEGNKGDRVTNPDGSYAPDKQDQLEDRDKPQKYAPEGGGSKSDGRYPTSLSGWAGFAAKGIAEGQTRDALGVLGIPDSMAPLDGFMELHKQIRIFDPKSQRTIFGGYDGKGDDRKKHKLFDTGGWLEPGATIAHNLTGKREAILTNDQWSTAERALSALPTPRSAPTQRDPAGVAGRGGTRDKVTYNISTARVEDAFTAARQREERRAAGAISRW